MAVIIKAVANGNFMIILIAKNDDSISTDDLSATGAEWFDLWSQNQRIRGVQGRAKKDGRVIFAC